MIFCFGDVIMDILVKASGPLKIGSDVEGSIQYQGGGSAANFAAWFAWLGGEVRFLAKVGEDAPGDFLDKDLRDRGVTTHLIRSTQHATGTILVLIDQQGERTMVTDRAANLALMPEEIETSHFSDISHLHFTGYSFFGSESLARVSQKTIRMAKDKGVTISIDPSSYGLLETFGVDRFLKLTTDVDYIFPNYPEGALLTGKQEPEAIVKKLEKHFSLVVLKLGEQGCLVGHQGELITVESEVRIADGDSTGAGDSFAAGFLFAYLQNKGLLVASQLANRTAAQCVRIPGGRPPRSN